MEAQEYAIVENSQEDHWWWLGRQRIIERLIERFCVRGQKRHLRIADVGSGFGANITMLRRYGSVIALEPSQDAVAKIRERWGADEAVDAVRWQCPEPVDGRFDLMLLADVLEHIEDDAAAVSWMSDHLAPGGVVILTVPAHRHLWTEMDEVVHHFRRYRRSELRRLLAAKLKVERISYYNLILYPVKVMFVLFARTRRRLFPARRKRSFNEVPPAAINNIFQTILSLEALFVERLSLPFGVSLVAVAHASPVPLGSSDKRAGNGISTSDL